MKLLLHIHVWAVYVAHSCYNYSRYFIYAWMPTFYTSVLAVSSSETGLHLICPEIVGVLAGYSSKGLNKQLSSWMNLSPLASRRTVSCGAFGLQTVILLLLAGMTTAGAVASKYVVTVLLCLHSSLLACHSGGFKATYLDLSQANTGFVCGVGNTIATVPGYVGPLVASYILDKYASWSLLWLMSASVSSLGCVVWATMSSLESVDVENTKATSKKIS